MDIFHGHSIADAAARGADVFERFAAKRTSTANSGITRWSARPRM